MINFLTLRTDDALGHSEYFAKVPAVPWMISTGR